MPRDVKKILRSGVTSVLSRPQDVRPTDETAGKEKKTATTAGGYGKGRPRQTDLEQGGWFTTSLSVDAGQYKRVEDIAYEMRMSKKAAMKALIDIGIQKYDRTGKL